MYSSIKGLEEHEMMAWVIRDDETDEIIGISPDAPKKVQAYYKLYIQSQNSTDPVVK